ncbi:MAG: nucleotidyltransferase domain-containing protein [Candidatus Shapirobacteria bacterium]|jgi:hypothetical protein
MSLEAAIKKTIEYAIKFDCYISKKEIEQRLISKNIFSKKEIKEALNNLKLVNKRNFWKLTKIKKAKELANKIKTKFDDILFLGISGSVASGYPKKNDDIDILVVTKSNTLWKTRLVLRWWIYKNKIPHRSFGKKEKANQFCFNLWLDENSLKLPKDKQNLKNSIDLILLKPLINKQKTYEKFLIKNDWAKNYVAMGYNKKIKPFISRQVRDISTKKGNFLDGIINFLVFWPQFLYMKKKIKKETVGLYQAFFHRPMIK